MFDRSSQVIKPPRTVQGAINIADLRLMAKRRLPKAVFDFVDGGAEDEITVGKNRRQFERWGFAARYAVNVAERTTEVSLFGERYAAPIAISGTGMAGLFRGAGDLLLADGAHRAGIPFTLATVSTVTIEDAAAHAKGPLWFQLYILRDRILTARLIERARVAGMKVLVVTVDCPVAGQRERDPRNSLTIPLRVTAANLLDLAKRVPWLIDMARHGEPKPANMIGSAGSAVSGQQLAAYMQTQLDATVNWDDVRWVRRLWDGPMVVKGLTSPEDARMAVLCGADGIQVSNHGGRQLDGAIPTLEALPRIADAVGDQATILCDSGFRRGTDIAKALALGANAICTGRATLFGLAAGGADGVFRAVTLLREELDRAMALTGCRSLEEITREKIVQVETS